MNNPRFWFLAGGALLSLTLALSGGFLLGSDNPKGPNTSPAPDDALDLAAKIDHHLSAQWSALKVQPAPLAEDAEFLRRVFLDVAGRIPSVSEARAVPATSTTSPTSGRIFWCRRMILIFNFAS
jgi:hypothetical protein